MIKELELSTRWDGGSSFVCGDFLHDILRDLFFDWLVLPEFEVNPVGPQG